MHGHNYQLLVKVYGRSEKWFDFAEIKRTVDDFVDEKYDHRDIGNMTCEKLAKQIQSELAGRFKTRVEVELWETGKFGVQTA